VRCTCEGAAHLSY